MITKYRANPSLASGRSPLNLPLFSTGWQQPVSSKGDGRGCGGGRRRGGGYGNSQPPLALLCVVPPPLGLGSWPAPLWAVDLAAHFIPSLLKILNF